MSFYIDGNDLYDARDKFSKELKSGYLIYTNTAINFLELDIIDSRKFDIFAGSPDEREIRETISRYHTWVNRISR